MQYEKIINELWEKAEKRHDDIENVVITFDSLVKDKANTLKEFGYGSYMFENEAKDFRNKQYLRVKEFTDKFKEEVLKNN